MTKPELMEIINKAAENVLNNCHTGCNSLEIWSHISDKIDISVRKAIGDQMEAAGRNRYTGNLIQLAAVSQAQENRCQDGHT